MLLKNKNLKYFALTFIILFVACSTKRDGFVNRNLHALNTEYNILYNGGLALDKGINDVISAHNDNFWEILPIERMQKTEETMMPGDSKNPNFERAETKATKAIQKHSMNIDGTERNPQIDEAYLMLGKSRYYEHRYFPALEAFNYILYKYPKSSNIYQASVWREKVNIRIDNEQQAINNLNKILKSHKVKGKDLADINAVLTEGFVKIQAYDSAIASIKIAKKETKSREERARYTFILGQLYEKLNYKDSAFVAYQEVINMKRKAPKAYGIFAQFRQGLQFDYQKNDSLVYIKKLNKLIENIEYKQHLDILYHQKALFYDNQKKSDLAIKYYKSSIKSFSNDKYLTASNYKNISKIYYDKHDFLHAKKYLDSCMIHLFETHKEYKGTKQKLNYLTQVVDLQNKIAKNDSIVKLFNMSDKEKESYFKAYIQDLKKKDSIAALKQNLQQAQQMQQVGNKPMNIPGVKSKVESDDPVELQMPGGMMPPSPTNTPPIKNLPSLSNVQSNFYFYNATTVSFGRIEFQKKWGNISLVDNWKWVKLKDEGDLITDDKPTDDQNNNVGTEENPKYTIAFYLDQLPKNSKKVDSLNLEANRSRFKLGEVFKELLKENELSKVSFNDILEHNPDAKLKLPTYYNLYLLTLNNPSESKVWSEKIKNEFPNSRYAEVLGTNKQLSQSESNTEFEQVYRLMKNGSIREAYAQATQLLTKYEGDELNVNFDFLYAQLKGRLFGIDAYKTELLKIAKSYPNSEAASKATAIVTNELSVIEKLEFGKPSIKYNLFFIIPVAKEKDFKKLLDKLQAYVKESGNPDLILTEDIYDLDNNLYMIHGFVTPEVAEATRDYLKVNKKYMIKEPAFVISNEDYKIVLANKKLNDFIKK